MHPNRALLVLCVASVIAGCRAKASTDAPDPPDVGPLRARYAGATGRLTPEVAPFVAAGLRAKIGQLAEGQTILTELLALARPLDADGPAAETDAGATDAAGLEAQSAALTFSADGWARIRHVCRGFSGADPPDARKNGRIDVYGTYDHLEGLADVVWGRFARCRLPAGAGARQELAGLATLDLPDLGKAGGRVALDLTWLDEAGVPEPLVLDFAFEPSGVLTVAQPLPDGTHVLVGLRLDETAGSVLTVDDVTGRWGCAVSAEGDHGECLRAALGTEVGFSW